MPRPAPPPQGRVVASARPEGSPMTLTAKPPAAAPPGDDGSGPAGASVSARRPRNLRTWVRGGGLSTLVFLAPMLFVFTIFSWSPIVQSVIMSLQKTNLLDPPTWV